MITAFRARLPRQHADGGFTLVEMLTVVLLLSIIIAVSMGELMGAQGQTRNNATRLDQTQQAKVAVEDMTKNLRTAVLPSQIQGSCSTCGTAFLLADWYRVQFYANINNPTNTIGPSQVSYTYDSVAKTLTEIIRPPDPHATTVSDYTYTCVNGTSNAFGTCKVSTRVIATSVVASSGSPLFAYYDYSQTQLGVPLASTQLGNVDSISLSLLIKSSPTVKGSTVLTHVTLPNADALIQSTASPTP
jgi:prepilin-type N-terminal cleavage/methylation domain-containing protein